MLPTLPLANSIGAARAAIAAPFPTMHPFPTSALLASSPMVDEDLATNIAGCVQEPLGPLGYLAVLAFSYLIYIVLPPPTHRPRTDNTPQSVCVCSQGYSTDTNAERERGEAELASRTGKKVVFTQSRRAFVVVLLLQGGAALFRRKEGKVCTVEEMRQRNEQVLKAKGFTQMPSYDYGYFEKFGKVN